MRLTLRTMLAYMDDLLDPAHAKEVSHRIEESEYATNLMHRMRDVTRRARLSAPELNGKGLGLDPNSVAEYLDHSLAADRVPDFETVCLESDMHLAEVVAAHQILTLVLNERAEVEPKSRRRMYALPAQVTAAAGVARETRNEPPVAEDHREPSGKRKRKKRQTPTVPDYLREPEEESNKGRRVQILVVSLLMIGILGLFIAFDPWGIRQRLAGTPLNQIEDKDGDASSEKGGSKDQGTDSGEAGGAKNSDDSIAENSSADDLTEPESGGGEKTNDGAPRGKPKSTKRADNDDGDSDPSVPASKSDEGPKMPRSSRSSRSTNEGAIPPEPDDNSGTTDKASESNSAGSKSSDTGSSDSDSIATESNSTHSNKGASPDANDLAIDDSTSKAAIPTADGLGEATPEIEPPRVEGMGRLISDRAVLLRYDVAKNHWNMLASRDTLYPADRLLALPTFRPTIALGAGLTAALRGPTSIALEAPDDNGLSGIVISRGRLLIDFTTGESKARIRIVDGPTVVIAGDVDSSAAIEVRRTFVPGADPEKSPSQIVAELYVNRGDVEWSLEGAKKTEMVTAPAHRLLAGPPAPAPTPDQTDAEKPAPKPGAKNAHEPTPSVLPPWVTNTEEKNLLSERASAAIQMELDDDDRPVSLQLRELSEHRQVEISSLAVQCLAPIGEFENSVRLLNDVHQRIYWFAIIESLRGAMAQSPEMAARVREEFERQRGAKGKDLYRMLRGFSSADLEAGFASRLVHDLNHDDADFRVLSFWNLQEITGVTLNYRPESTEAKRREAVLKWENRLKRGEIKWKIPLAAKDR